MSAPGDDEQVEETLAMIPEVFVYKIPPRTSADSHRASDWDRDHHIWLGRLRVTAQGEVALIRLEDKTSGNLFAVCKVVLDDSPPAYEAVIDSSRFFVLKLKDEASQRTAFIGIGFSDRSHAFDFKAALQDHEKYVRTQRELAANPPQYKHVDLSLHEGQTFKLNIKSGVPERPKFSSSDSSDDGDDFGLAPPPAGKKGAAPAATTATRGATTQQLLFDTAPAPTQHAQAFQQFQAPVAATPSPSSGTGGALAELSFLSTPTQAAAAPAASGNWLSGFNAAPVAPAATTSDPFASLVTGTGVRPATGAPAPAVSGWGDFSGFNTAPTTQQPQGGNFDWGAFQ